MVSVVWGLSVVGRKQANDAVASEPNIFSENHAYKSFFPCRGEHVRTLSCDGHQLYERSVDLEVEGVRYIEMHRGPAAYVLGPPPSRSRDLKLEGGVIACHVDYVYEPQDSHVRGTD